MTLPRSPKHQADEDRAVAWLVTLNPGDAEESDWQAFTAWLEAEPGHRAAFDRAEQLWADLDDHVEALRPARVEQGSPLAAPAPRRTSRGRTYQRRRPWLAAPAAAAAAAAAAVVAGFMVLSPSPRLRTPGETLYQTGVGERRTVALADGTRVTLAGRSSIGVRLTASERRVRLAPGSEVAFDVHHEAARPFVVAAGDRQVRVLGTEFVTEREQGRLVVSVRRGVVQVEALDRAAGEAPMRLVRGQQLTYAEGAGRSSVRIVPPDEAFSWTAGRRVYRESRLSDVAFDLGRDLAVPIQVDAKAARLRFTGVLVIDSEDAVVRRLESLLPVVAERTPASITLRARGPGAAL